jgi:translocation protein SEC63
LADEKQIKSHYKRLSLKFHPDKIRPDPAKNQTIESLNDYFVELTKAYKALTDEEIRNNYIQFGHPDGKQSFSIGIALPKFIISDGAGKYVLLVYALLLGVLLPYLVGTWWYGTQRMSKEKVLIESANNLFREYDANIGKGEIVGALSCGSEFQSMLKGEKAESGLGKLEPRILDQLSPKHRTKLEDLDGGVRRKALGLLWAYLGRAELDDASLNEAKFEVAPIAHALNQAFTAICLAFGSTAPILGSYAVTQSLIQAIPPEGSPLLQLPYVTPSIAKAIEGDAKTHLTLQKFMQIPESKRRELAVGKRLLSESQYKTAISVAQQIPDLQVAKAFFKVVGEKHIIPGSLVSMVVKGRFIPPGSANVPEINDLDLEDIDPDEGDLDAILGRAKKAKKNEKGEKVPVAEETPVQPPLASAPYYARDYSPRWHVFLTDSKQGKIAVPPFTFTTFDKPIFGDDGKPTFNMQTLKAQFQAPPQAGQYTFVMHLICDSYVGMDTKMEVTLLVEEASKAEEMQPEDDISEPDEGKPVTHNISTRIDVTNANLIADSLAGQMQMMKTGSAPSKKKKPAVEESSDEESDTEEADNTSDTNTDTDEE